MKIGTLVGLCFESRTLAHIAHLRATGPGSEALHEALAEYYDAVVSAADALSENAVARYGEVALDIKRVVLPQEPLPMLLRVRDWIDSNRNDCGEHSEIQNLIDEVLTVVNKAIYKVVRLQ